MLRAGTVIKSTLTSCRARVDCVGDSAVAHEPWRDRDVLVSYMRRRNIFGYYGAKARGLTTR